VSKAEQALLFTLRIPAIPAAGPAVLASVTPAHDAAVTREVLVLRAAQILEAAIAQADTGGAAGALERLKAFLLAQFPVSCLAPELIEVERELPMMLEGEKDQPVAAAHIEQNVVV
jgi:hypothetical protein